MAEIVIYARTTRDALRQVLAHIPKAARDGGTTADAMMTRCGLAALGRIKAAFVTKARGGTDEAGDRWAPLSPYTIARRRNKTPPIEILRDTGLLLNSLSPGTSGSQPTKPTSEESVFRVLPGEVIVGTNRKWAYVHHNGSVRRGVPQRRLWPQVSKWPRSWWVDLLEQARAGLIDVAVQLMKGL